MSKTPLRRAITPSEAERLLSKEKYAEAVSKLAETGALSIAINFFDIYEIDEQLGVELMNNPRPMLKELSDAAYSKLVYRNPDYAAQIRKLDVQIRSLPHETAIRDVRSENITHLIQVNGIIVKSTNVKPTPERAAFTCLSCGEVTIVDQIDQYLITPQKCEACNGRRFAFSVEDTGFKDVQWITIQERPEELPPGQLPHSMTIKLMGDLVGSVNPGDRITATCIVDVRQLNKNSVVMEISLEASHLELISTDLEVLEITPQDEREIRELASDPWVHRRVMQSIAPSIYGLERVKEAIAYLLFGGVPKQLPDARIRGDINALLVGDPGTGKSQLLQYTSQTAPRGLFTMGRGSTAAGLTAAAVKEEGGGFVLEAGALVLADMGVCCIDELEKMRPEDRSAIHPAMEQQIVSIAKGGIVAELNARCSILAAANPSAGRYNPYQNLGENLGNLPVTLLNRFDLIFLIQDVPDMERDRKTAEHILGSHSGRAVPPPIPTEKLRKYISYSKRINPKIPEEIQHYIIDFYLEMRRASLNQGQDAAVMITNRQLESLIRITEARARLHLREEATPEDAEAAISIIQFSLEQVGVDVTTGKPDIDIIMTGKPRSLQVQLQKCLGLVSEPKTRAVQDEELFAALEKQGIGRAEAAKLIGILMREGRLFSPRPGWYKRT